MFNITSLQHPDYIGQTSDWALWRATQAGGTQFVNQYVKKFSKREKDTDYTLRKSITPVQSHAKAAVTNIQNAVFQRMPDVVRNGGSPQYQKAVAGKAGGVDRKGSSMSHFIGTKVLPDLLFMGRVGVFVDNSVVSAATLADDVGLPYMYSYRVEDIVGWEIGPVGTKTDFTALLLRDYYTKKVAIPNSTTFMSSSLVERYRLVWIENGKVHYQFYDIQSKPITASGQPDHSGPKTLDLERIPFVMFEINDSLLRDIAQHQVVLTNLRSANILYDLKANVPFYTEQRDNRAAGSHLKTAIGEDGTSSSGGQASAENEIQVGGTDGRFYAPMMERPGFISPPSEPLQASLELQRRIEDDIERLVNLAVSSLGNSRKSGEARQYDNQGLEAGLSYIAQVLQNGENRIAEHWSAYEGDSSRQTVMVKYPERFTLKSMQDKLDEAQALSDLMDAIPSKLARKEFAKIVVNSLLGGHLLPEQLLTILGEIQDAPYTTSDPEVIAMVKDKGLASDITLSEALGFDGEKEVEQAKQDHADRVKRLQQAQVMSSPNPAARGIPDLDADAESGKIERQQATDSDLQDSTEVKERGKGK